VWKEALKAEVGWQKQIPTLDMRLTTCKKAPVLTVIYMKLPIYKQQKDEAQS
jgi:hypothetical protein